MSAALDYAWRIPVAFLIRAPLMIVGIALTWVGNAATNIADDVPGLPYRAFRSRQD